MAEPHERRRIPAGQAIGVILVALLVAALVDAEGLVRVAERQPYGARRDVALAVARPLERLSDLTRLNRPVRWLSEATDGDEPELATPVTLAPTTTSTTTTAPPPATTATTVRGEGRPSPTAPATTTTSTTEPPRRTPTAEDPLRVWMAGDSMIGNLATAVGQLVAGDARYRLDSRIEIATGLARPDVLDWPAAVAAQMAEHDPEVVVLMFGGNDDQDMRAGDRHLTFATPEWQAEYRYRVALTMDQAAQDGRTVIWVGMPYTNRERLNTAVTVLNEIARTEAQARPNVSWFDVVPALSPGGAFQQFLPGPGGTVRAREGDGVHVTIDGWRLVAPYLLATIAEEYDLLA